MNSDNRHRYYRNSEGDSRSASGNYNRGNANWHEQDDRNSDRFRSYRDHDYEMEQDYYDNVQGERHNLDDIRQGYGYSSFGGSSDRYDEGRRMERERNAQRQQGYGSDRMGGYSGSRFGGANYSSHGSFGGSPDYGAMSGGGGNADDYVSSSGYGGGYGSQSVHSHRGVPDYSSRKEYGYSQGSSGYGLGSSYGGKNYGGGVGYSGGSRGGSFGRETYGSASGNYSGFDSMAGNSYNRSIDDDGYMPEARGFNSRNYRNRY
ncbi:hypothetical protein ACSX1A_10155 [Pontibacter sp. MBLB2868]|uniref:hypothetical protein n=1 Tax=Pontibacter sp. MBLB2868 TaxID=3451555 RepID=UPI003F74CD1F